MPIYEYRCSKCGDFEAMQKMSDKPLATCPTCRRKVTKLMSSTSFQLKGSGWYITDYARKGDADARKKNDSKGDKSDSTKSESAKSDSTKSDSTSTDSGKSDSAKSGGDGGSDSSGSKKKGKKNTPKAAAA